MLNYNYKLEKIEDLKEVPFFLMFDRKGLVEKYIEDKDIYLDFESAKEHVLYIRPSNNLFYTLQGIKEPVAVVIVRTKIEAICSYYQIARQMRLLFTKKVSLAFTDETLISIANG